MTTAPQTTPYDRCRISESRRLLFVPGGSANWLDLELDQPVSHQRNHREQSEKYRRRPSNRQIVPLPLRLDASDNVAKPLIEFAVYIPRERLRPAPADRRRHR